MAHEEMYWMKLELKEWHLNPMADEDSIQTLERSLGWALPADYAAFLRLHDGGEGFIGENYLILWRVAELAPFNLEYEVYKYAPGLFLFGSSGGGEAYGFDLRDPSLPIVRVPFIGMELKYAIFVARNFTDFVTNLARTS